MAHKGFAPKTVTVKIPAKAAAKVTDLVTNENIPATFADNQLQFQVASGPMELSAFLVQ